MSELTQKDKKKPRSMTTTTAVRIIIRWVIAVFLIFFSIFPLVVDHFSLTQSHRHISDCQA
jgi:hypothetical protein